MLRGLTVVRIAPRSERTLPVGRVNGNRGDLDEDLVLPNGGNRTFFRLDGCVRLDDDGSVGLWDFEVGHIEGRVEMYAVVYSVLSEIVGPIYTPTPYLILLLIGRYFGGC